MKVTAGNGPPDIEMSEEIRQRVSQRWAELGLDDLIPSHGV